MGQLLAVTQEHNEVQSSRQPTATSHTETDPDALSVSVSPHFRSTPVTDGPPLECPMTRVKCRNVVQQQPVIMILNKTNSWSNSWYSHTTERLG